MGLEKIRQAVISAAKAEADLIVEGARKHSEELLRSKKEEATKEFERSYRARASAIEDELNRRLIQFRGTASKKVLEKRNGLLRNLFEKARREVLDWPDAVYAEVMGRVVENASGGSAGRLRVHRDDRALFEAVLSKINETRGPGKKLAVDETESLAERGGFLFLAADYEVDQTLGEMLGDIEAEMLPRIAADLFSA